jgi:hypothetical protein
VAPSFSASLTEVAADIGWFQDVGTVDAENPPLITPFGSAGAGLQVTVMTPERWPTHVNPALHGYAAFGVHSNGHVDVVVQARAALAARVDFYEGRANGPTPLVWRYYPGSASFSVLAGLRF